MPSFIDADTVTLKNVTKTPEGYLAADAFAVRTGIQRYLGSEVGRPDLPFVDVFRSEDEVFSKAAVATFAHKPVTVDHPPGGVDSSTWRDRAVGEVSTEAMRDGERLRIQLIVKDSVAVKQVLDGTRRQLSAGYTCDLEWSDGTTPDGKPYQAIQRNIKINHLALVQQGRAGNCAIGDSAWGAFPVSDDGAAPQTIKEVQMDVATLVLGDAAVKVVAEDESKVVAFLAKHAGLTADIDKLRGENAALTQKLADAEMTPQKLQKLVADRAVVAAGYKALTGKDAPSDLADADLRRAAVTAKLGDSAKDMSDDAIAGAFAAFSVAAPAKDPIRDGVATADSFGTNQMKALFDSAGVPMKKEA